MSEGIANATVSEVKIVASAIYDALEEADPEAVIRGKPKDGRTLVDGRFDLRFVAARILRSLGAI